MRAFARKTALLFALWLPFAFAEDAPILTSSDASSAFKTGDVRAAFRIWKQLAQNGDKIAMYNLALSLDDGNGTHRDPDAAASWYQKAAQLGVAKAANNLAVMYSVGRSMLVPQYDELAIYWYQFAAHAGDDNAKFNLALRYPELNTAKGPVLLEINVYRELALIGAARAHQRDYYLLN